MVTTEFKKCGHHYLGQTDFYYTHNPNENKRQPDICYRAQEGRNPVTVPVWPITRALHNMIIL